MQTGTIIPVVASLDNHHCPPNMILANIKCNTSKSSEQQIQYLNLENKNVHVLEGYILPFNWVLLKESCPNELR